MKDEKVLYRKKLWGIVKGGRLICRGASGVGEVGPYLYKIKMGAKYDCESNELPVRVKVTVERL